MARSRGQARLLLVRSGETEWESQGRIRGRTDLPLSPQGVERLSAALPGAPNVEVVRHATDEASIATARLLARSCGVRRRKLAGIEPPNLGLFEGLSLEEANERYPARSRIWQEDPIAVNPPEGEPLLEVTRRSGEAVARMLLRSRSQLIGLVAHPVIIGTLRLLLADVSTARYHELEQAAPRLELYLLTSDASARLRRQVAAIVDE